MKEIVVIGGSGFIGSRLISRLRKHYQVKNVDKNPSPVHEDISVRGDVREPAALDTLLKGADAIILMAAEHKDDVSPVGLYYDVNVTGTENVLKAMVQNGVNKIIFTSSVAVYGLNKVDPDETHPVDPFNDYGVSKWKAEEALRRWQEEDPELRELIIIRPTVVFGEGNRGNVYNLLKQIAEGKFLMVGKGQNKKSMSYVENVADFITFCADSSFKGYRLFNYVDKPDLTTKELILQAEESLGKKISPVRVPYFVGYAGGLFFDVLAKISGKKFPVSAVRVKKFCATTQISSINIPSTGFTAKHSLSEGLDLTIKSINKTM